MTDNTENTVDDTVRRLCSQIRRLEAYTGTLHPAPLCALAALGGQFCHTSCTEFLPADVSGKSSWIFCAGATQFPRQVFEPPAITKL